MPIPPNDSSFKSGHPAEELLTEHALGMSRAEVADHVAECEECRRLVAEIASVKKRLGVLAEDEVPEGVRERIFNRHQSRSRKPGKLRPAFGKHYTRNLFLIILGLIAIMAFLYAVLVFIL
jgi:predicted anti-sigma-YlaC factor YlaD